MYTYIGFFFCRLVFTKPLFKFKFKCGKKYCHWKKRNRNSHIYKICCGCFRSKMERKREKILENWIYSREIDFVYTIFINDFQAISALFFLSPRTKNRQRELFTHSQSTSNTANNCGTYLQTITTVRSTLLFAFRFLVQSTWMWNQQKIKTNLNRTSHWNCKWEKDFVNKD